jgi:hypothetical protein
MKGKRIMKLISFSLITIIMLLLVAAAPLQAQINDPVGIFTPTKAFADTIRYALAKNGPTIATTGYVGGVAFYVMAADSGGTLPTLDIKVQTAGTDSTFADIAGKTFTQITTTTTCVGLNVSARLLKKWTRLVFTVTGTTPKYWVSAIMIGQKRY